MLAQGLHQDSPSNHQLQESRPSCAPIWLTRDDCSTPVAPLPQSLAAERTQDLPIRGYFAPDTSGLACLGSADRLGLGLHDNPKNRRSAWGITNSGHRATSELRYIGSSNAPAQMPRSIARRGASRLPARARTRRVEAERGGSIRCSIRPIVLIKLRRSARPQNRGLQPSSIAYTTNKSRAVLRPVDFARSARRRGPFPRFPHPSAAVPLS